MENFRSLNRHFTEDEKICLQFEHDLSFLFSGCVTNERQASKNIAIADSADSVGKKHSSLKSFEFMECKLLHHCIELDRLLRESFCQLSRNLSLKKPLFAFVYYAVTV